MSRKITKELLTKSQYDNYLDNSYTINFWRENPALAIRELLGIQLLDFQKLIVEMFFKAEFIVLAMCRNSGKSLLSAIIIMITVLLYPEEEAWIISATGVQSKKLFSYVEDLSLGNLENKFGELPDLFSKEVKTSFQSPTGFSHNSTGYKFQVDGNNSKVGTLNSNVNNLRSQRSTLNVVDEAGFCVEELFASVASYLTTNSDFKTDAEDVFFDIRTKKKNKPNRALYISSVSDKTSEFYKKYREYAIRMFAGDTRYFVLDLNIEIPLHPTMNGRKYTPLLSQSVVDTEMATNKVKAMREYYNVWDQDSDDQIIKSNVIERNSTFQLPEVAPIKGAKYGLFYDPAQSADNSIVLVGKTEYDDKIGWHGSVANMSNFKDLKDTSVKNRQMLYPDQVDELRKLLVKYNGDGAEYENVQTMMIDSGSGGGGLLYAGTLLLYFKDAHTGDLHRGIIDDEYFAEKVYDYPNAYPLLSMIEPSKFRNKMVQELIDLLDLNLIKFPKEYNGSGHVDLESVDEKGESTIQRRVLTDEEQLALINIDLCKTECKVIHKYKTSSGKYIYKVREDLSRDFHDDRFYTLLMFAHHIHMLRNDDTMKNGMQKEEKDDTILSLCTTK